MKFTGIRTSRAGSGCKRIQVADIAKRAAKRTQRGTASCLGKSRTLTRRNSSASVHDAWRWRVAALLRSFSCFSIQNITSGLWVIAYTVESVAVCAALPELDREGTSTQRAFARAADRGDAERLAGLLTGVRRYTKADH